MVSDDTEHTFMVAQSLLDESNDAGRFAKKLAWRLRWWLLRLPAGVGMATARACLKLWCGFSPRHSGVFSAGNGAAMRAAIFGGVFPDAKQRAAFVAASTRLTHTDPKALTGALAVADIVALMMRQSPGKPALPDVLRVLREPGSGYIPPPDAEWLERVEQMETAWRAGLSVTDFADRMGCAKGVGGYVYHTAPVAMYAWMQHFGDFRAAVESVVECGGDTDTVAAIVGALAGANGAGGIPSDWITGIFDAPINPSRLRDVAERLTQLVVTGQSPGHAASGWLLTLPRNLFFLGVVLCHGFRRLLPPY
jgi:ADP-ribosylglycohydrolase